MTSQASEKSRSVYLAVRSRCRQAGLAMDSADPVIRAFHAAELYDLHAVAAALKQHAVVASHSTPVESKETKGDTKSDWNLVTWLVWSTRCGSHACA